jgi:drug/metabolite transporter (DMT)-like permease
VRGVRGTRAFDVALLLVLEPVLSTLLAWVVHNEVPGTWAAAGSVVIVLGLILHAAQTAESP